MTLHAECSYCNEKISAELGEDLGQDIVSPCGLYHRKCYEAQSSAVLALAERNEAARRANLERQRADGQQQLCNFCGENCMLGHDPRCGLDANVEGGYWSTPGNGDGALDDMTRYSFRVCEFCLDWLFSGFRIPVTLTDYGTEEPLVGPWRSAAQRVAEDGWREDKAAFLDESKRRAELRRVMFYRKGEPFVGHLPEP